MADDVPIKDAADVSRSIATDEIAGRNFQIVKAAFGSDGAATQVDAANPLPVTLSASGPSVTAANLTNASIGGVADAAASADTGSFSLNALIKRGLANWTALLARIPALVSGRIPTDGSGVTQPVSGTFWQATQPVSGAVSVSNMVAQGLTDAQLRATALPISGNLTAAGTHFQPGYDLSEGVLTSSPLLVDPDGNLVARAQVLTDEGSYRVNFANSSLAVAVGTATFTNGSDQVTGTGFLAADVRSGDYIKLNADAEAAWMQVDSLNSNTSLTLIANYTGTGGTGACSRAIVKPVTGAGGAIAVASGVCTITSGTTAGSITEVERDVDWLPLVKQAGVAVSQRIANQGTYVGFYDETTPAAPKWFAWFLLDGTTNTTVKCQSARNPTQAPVTAEIEETVITLPNGGTSATAQRYRVEILGERCCFYVNGVLVATHFKSMPGPGDLLTSTVRVLNGTTPASSTTVTIDYDSCKNHNKVEVGLMSDSEQVVAVAAPLQQFSYSVAGVIAINTDLLVIDCLQLRSLFIQCNSMGTTGTVTVQWANDAAFAAPITATLLNEAGASSTTFNAAGLRVTNVLARYCRLRLTVATTAGTTTINAWGAQTSYVPTVNQVTGSVSSNPVASTQLIGDVGIQFRATTPGTTLANVLTAATNNLTQLKASAGKVAGGFLTNTTASLQYVKLFALPSASVTMGTTSATTQIALQPNQTVNLAQGDFGTFLGGTGVTYAVTTGSALNDNTATTAGSVVGYVLWI